jgi:hypothetical protein
MVKNSSEMGHRKQEAGAIYMSIRAIEWILRGKYFIIETDSKNILFLEQSLPPSICRWRIFLQGFFTCLRFLLGKYNIIADWLSRQYCLYLIDHYESHPVHTPVRTTVSTLVSTEDTIHTSICNASLDSFMIHTLMLLLSSGSSVAESPEPLNLSPIFP